MNVAEAQQDMRNAFHGGATGVLASAAVWFVAGVVATVSSPGNAVWALLVGGMMIHPAAVLLARALGRPGTPTPGNPLAALALEGTFFFLLAIPLAYAISRYRVEWFFPAMLLLIGGRYLTFATLYGMRVYWACGATLALAGFLVAFVEAPVSVGAFAGAVVELGFAAVVLVSARRGGLASARYAA